MFFQEDPKSKPKDPNETMRQPIMKIFAMIFLNGRIMHHKEIHTPWIASIAHGP